VHIALRGLQDVSVRWDILQEGALGGCLPNLQIPSQRMDKPDGELLVAQDILTWIDGKIRAPDDFQGLKTSSRETKAMPGLCYSNATFTWPSKSSSTSHSLSATCSSWPRTGSRHWRSLHLPSFIIPSSNFPRPLLNDQMRPSSCPHQCRSLASRLSYPFTVCVSRQVPLLHDTVMQSPLSRSAWDKMSGS
jgi:hypothetical protein